MINSDIMSLYAEEFFAKTGKTYWFNARSKKQLMKLQMLLDRYEIEAKNYFDLISKWMKSTIPEGSIIPLNVLCSKSSMERYRNLEPTTYNDMMHSLMNYIEYNCANYYINLRANGPGWVRYEGELDDWIANEMSFFPEYPKWDELIKQHPTLHRNVVTVVINTIRQKFGISTPCYDYIELAEKVYDRRYHG